MKNTVKIISFVLSVVIAVGCMIPSFAYGYKFDGNAYANIVTASDFQDEKTDAYERFGNILSLAKKDGLKTPDTMLMGGDFSKMWPDYATPGEYLIKESYTSVFEDADPDSVICVQGNHDFYSSGFVKTGFYDMGSYCLYAIDENDFPWNQFLRPTLRIKALASDVSDALEKMIEEKDFRPVIIMTHVPLHHSSRTGGGDNMYSSFLFDAINKAAEKLDIIFIFGHNHSGDYDDYIGGAVNFLKPGDTIRIPKTNKMGDDCYTEEKLNFTYTNCGYVGYSDNGTENGSTNKLSVGIIQICRNKFHFVRYTEDGFYSSKDVYRMNRNSAVNKDAVYPSMSSEILYNFETKIFSFLYNLYLGIFG